MGDMSEKYRRQAGGGGYACYTSDGGAGSRGCKALNPWNKFQHEHAGLGWSRSEMSEAYHSQADDSAGSDGDYRNLGRDTSDDCRASNPWNEIHREQAGEGLSR